MRSRQLPGLLAALSLLLVVAVAGCGSSGAGSSPAMPEVGAVPVWTVGSPCTGRSTHVTHVVWILLENKPTGAVLGSPSAPFLNGLAHRCGVATNDHGVTHPSLPNYIALTSGSTQGVTDDKSPAAHPLAVRSIFSQLDASGRTWKSYEEQMPANCRRTDSGRYAVRHNPATYYVGLRSCASRDVPFGQLAGDLSAGTLPAFSFLTPDLCDDMHNCSVATGDAWLSREVPALLSSPDYRSGSTALFIAFDEDDHTNGNRIPLFVVAPGVRPATVSSVAFRHPALLDLTEQLLGVPALPGATGGTDLRHAFGL